MVTQKKAAAECISEDALRNLKSYKYSSIEKSPIAYYIVGPFGNFCVTFLPPWLAPNMVTLLGFFFIIGNVALQQIYDPEFLGPKQAWVYYSYALGVWAYQTMDNIDGKQARRTGMSSPLGELFDHGIDSLNCTLASLLMVSAVGLGSTPIGAFTALIPTLPMFFSTWETYHTHTLYLGYFNGPCEGLIIASSIMIASGIYGPHIWRLPLANVVGFANILGKLTAIDVWVYWLLSGFLFAHLPECLSNALTATKKQNLSFASLAPQWTQMVVFCASLLAWLGSPYSTLLADNHLALLCLTMSFVFGRMTTKIILAHLTKQPYPYSTALLLPLVGGAILVNLPYFGLKPVLTGEIEHYYLWAYFVLAVAVYFRWAYLVINAICGYLEIPCFTVPEEKQRAFREAKQSGTRQANGSANAKKVS